jgi:histidyl-tRNA synthetase
MSKPSIPKGTRDFSPEVVTKRTFIFDTIRSVFKKYGYQPIETPTMENLSTLTGKYGDEGDQLIFKVLNSGDYLSNVSDDKLATKNSKSITSDISEKALRYDLTVPFARYVVMHQNEISFPFKRYQIQPVWRADRPQKGRYREFYQCDADVVGSESLLNEAEFVLIYDEALSLLGLKDFEIRINNRKILAGIAEIVGKPELLIDMTVAIDKLDKIGFDGVTKELLEKGFTENDINTLSPIINLAGSNENKLKTLSTILSSSSIGLKGIEELHEVFNYFNTFHLKNGKLILDITLARGLNYYTGAIFEVKTNEVDMGSIGGGGRYDDLTGMFGLKNLTGVGVSFGADRIYDVMEELKLFPENTLATSKVLITHFDEKAFQYALPIIQKLRDANISSELYPNIAKMQKQMKYANDKGVPYVIVIGDEEMSTGLLAFKNMHTGEQQKLSIDQIIHQL